MVFLSYKMASMLIGESALPEENARVLAALTEQVGIESVIHMRTLHTGSEEFLVAAKVAVDPAVEDPRAWSHIVPVDEPPPQGDATGK